MFSTLMNERHNTSTADFGGLPGAQFEFKGTHCVSIGIGMSVPLITEYVRIGMAGNQVLEWFDIDSEIKTANLKDVCTCTISRDRTVLTRLIGPACSPRPVSVPVKDDETEVLTLVLSVS